MSFVLRRADGKFAKGRQRWRTEWVDDLSKARVFPRRSDAKISATTTFSNHSRYYGGGREMAADLEILPVKLVLAE